MPDDFTLAVPLVDNFPENLTFGLAACKTFPEKPHNKRPEFLTVCPENLTLFPENLTGVPENLTFRALSLCFRNS